MKNKKIIHIILVNTIVILLILAVIVIIQTTKEKVMLSKVKQEKEKYTISETKEKLELEITNLRIEQESKGETLTKEDLPKINNAEIDVRSVVNFPVEVLCNGQKFEIDENFNVNYIGEANGTIVTYTIDPEKSTNGEEVSILIKIENEKGIKTIEYPNGDKLKCNGKVKIGIDYNVEKNGIYKFKIISEDNEEIVKDVLIYKIDRLKPKDFTINVKIKEIGSITVELQNVDDDEDNENYKSGISRFKYVIREAGKDDTSISKYVGASEMEYKFENLKSLYLYDIVVYVYDVAGNINSSEIQVRSEYDSRLDYPILTSSGMMNCKKTDGTYYRDFKLNTKQADALPKQSYNGLSANYSAATINQYYYFQIDKSLYGKKISILCQTENSEGCHGNIFFGTTKTGRDVGGGALAQLSGNTDLNTTWKTVEIPNNAKWCSLGLDRPGANPVRFLIYDIKII